MEALDSECGPLLENGLDCVGGQEVSGGVLNEEGRVSVKVINDEETTAAAGGTGLHPTFAASNDEVSVAEWMSVLLEKLPTAGRWVFLLS